MAEPGGEIITAIVELGDEVVEWIVVLVRFRYVDGPVAIVDRELFKIRSAEVRGHVEVIDGVVVQLDGATTEELESSRIVAVECDDVF